MARYFVIALLTSILLHGAAAVQTATYEVKADGSGDAPTIQAAIDMAVSEDRVVVWGGYYGEDDLLVEGKNINFQNLNGTPVITSSSYRQGTGITFRNVNMTSNLLGFEFREFARGISIENSAGMYWYCNIIDCGVDVGAYTQLPGCTGTAVEETSWGAIKKMHR